MAIVIVEPSSSGLALLDAAMRLGERVYCFSADEDDRIVAADRLAGIPCVKVETLDPLRIVAAVLRLDDVVTAVIPGFEYVVASVAVANEALGLPHLSVEAAALTRDKYQARAHLAAAGLRVPAFFRIDVCDDIDEACRQVGFPAVLKPVDGCGSLRVRKVEGLDEVHAALVDLNRTFVDMGNAVGRSYLLERYLSGPEYSVEGYVTADEVVVVAITEKLLGAEPYFVEMGHLVEAALDVAHRACIFEYVQTVVTTLGIGMGVFHAELRVEEGVPVLIEVAARLGGDRIYRLVELVRGVSLPAIMLRSYQGRSLDRLPGPARDCAAVRFFAPANGVCPAIGERFSREIRAFPGVVEFEIYHPAGTRLPPLQDFRGRMGHVVVQAPDREALDRQMAQALRRIEDQLTQACCA